MPNLAMEAHAAAIDRVVEQALARAGITASQLDAVAVTVGPGLALCLRVGVAKARHVAREHQIPIVHCHHMEGHALVARLPKQQQILDSSIRGAESLTGASSSSSLGAVSSSGEDASSPSEPAVAFPFLCLLVSGGHNLLLLVRGVGQYVQLGSTLDDALGEPTIEDLVFPPESMFILVWGSQYMVACRHFEISPPDFFQGKHTTRRLACWVLSLSPTEGQRWKPLQGRETPR